jgi:hypothetical protein
MSCNSLIQVTVAVFASVVAGAAPVEAQLASAPNPIASVEISASALERVIQDETSRLEPEPEVLFRVRWAVQTLPGAAVENSTVVLEGELSDGTKMLSAPKTVTGRSVDFALPAPPAGVEFDAFTVRVTSYLDSAREGYPIAEDMNGLGLSASAVRRFLAHQVTLIE